MVVPVSSLPSVAIESFGGTGGPQAADVVRADLKRTSEINPTTGLGSYVLSGEFNGNTLTGTLSHHGNPTPLFSQSFTGDYRSAAHQLSDAVVLAITKHPGFATSKLAFIGSAGGKELYLADIDGFKARPITSDHVICSCPAFGYGAGSLAYTSYKSGYADLYLINLSSGARNRIAFFPGINSGPSFSPDGARIALTLSKDGNPEIYTITPNGDNPVRITHTRGSETSPSFSPAGDQLVFSSDDRGTPQLFTASSTGGGGLNLLHTLESYCTKPDWSPDGQTIAFTTRLSGEFQIALFSLSTNTTKVLTQNGGENPAWTRDSRHLVFDNHGKLYLLDTVSESVLPIEVGSVSAVEPAVSR